MSTSTLGFRSNWDKHIWSMCLL